jgi:hypothetical protein
MDLIIADTHGETFVWKVQDEKIARVRFKDISRYMLFPNPDLDIGYTLPYELAEKVIFYIFWQYVKHRSYDLATSLLSIHKCFLRLIYKTLLGGNQNIPEMEMYRRVCRTLNFCESLDDFLLTPTTLECNTAFRTTRVCPPHLDHPLRPWQFGKYTYTELITTGFYRGDKELINLNVGEIVGDIVWVEGTFKNGMYTEATIFHPVINIVLANVSDNVLPIHDKFCRNDYFRKFVDLLKFVYGPTAAINFMTKEDENPFITSTNSFISF